MPVDTRNKRAGVFGFLHTALPAPSGVSSSGSRSLTVWIYPGLAFDPPPPPTITRPFTGPDFIALRGVRRVRSSIRWDVLDAQLNLKFEIHPNVDRPAQVSVNVTSAYKRSLRDVVLIPAQRALIDPTSDRLRPSWVYEDGSSYPLGVYLWQGTDLDRRTVGDLFHASVMVDQTWILDQPRRSSFSVRSGERPSDKLKVLAAEVGLPITGIESSAIVTTGDIAWKTGTTRLKMMNELCAQCGFYEPYFDNDGLLICRSIVALDVATPDFTYPLDETSRILVDTITESDDSWKAPNVFLVVNTSATASEISGSYEVPFSAPNSVGHRGFEIVKTISDPGVQDSDQAAVRARDEAAKAGVSTVIAKFSTVPNPAHDTYAIVEYDGENYTEQAFTLPLWHGAVMSHTATRIFTAA